MTRRTLFLEVCGLREDTFLLHLDIIMQDKPGEHGFQFCHREESAGAINVSPVHEIHTTELLIGQGRTMHIFRDRMGGNPH